MTLHEYIKPEEEAKKALKAQKAFEALERAKQLPCSDSPPRFQEHQGRSSVQTRRRARMSSEVSSRPRSIEALPSSKSPPKKH
jgi:hypothetical protein